MQTTSSQSKQFTGSPTQFAFPAPTTRQVSLANRSMKKLLLFLSLLLAARAGFSQGTVTFNNTSATQVRTNALAVGGTNGPTSPVLNGFVYGLFAAPFGTTNTDLTSGAWAFTGLYATNSGAVTGGRFIGGFNVPTLTGWLQGVTNSYVVAGWSTSLAGRDWTNILGQLTGAQFSGGKWIGNWNTNGFYGQSSIGFGEAGGGDIGLPGFPIFGSIPGGLGTPISTGFDLFATVVGVPLTVQPADQTVVQGSNATFTVSSSSQSVLTYQWSFNGTPIQDATNSSLTISNTQPANAGGYAVLLGDGVSRSLSRTAALTVLVPPSITLSPQSQAVFAGTNVTFTVGINGTAPLSYQWSLNGVNMSGATLASLALASVQLSDSGDYAVAVTNAAGWALSAPATLTVMAAPSITNQPVSTTGYWGKSVTITSGATGSGPLSFQWYKDGNLIAGATNAALTLNDSQLGDAGGYTVVVSNAYGTVTSSVANLIINPAGVSLGMYAGLTVDGSVGKTYDIQFSTNFVSWTTLTSLTLTDPVQLWVDTNINVSAPGHPNGSYRVQAVP